jgi:hypothetical protein
MKVTTSVSAVACLADIAAKRRKTGQNRGNENFFERGRNRGESQDV